jgi:hypothetical protein
MTTASATPPVAAGSAATLADFRDLHRGQTVVVCGCGESLNRLEQPERFVTIGVNDVGRRFTPDYLVVLNPRSQFTGDRFRYIETSRAKALFTQLADLGVPHPRVVRFRLGRYGGTDLSAADVLHYTRNSPYVAIGLAVHMGAARIGVLGVDFTENHFFAPTGVHHLARNLGQIDAEYARLASACRDRGIEIVNLSPTSRLTAWPRGTLEDFAGRGATPAVATPAPVPAPAPRRRRVFFVNYRFLACGEVFATGLAHAADTLGIEHQAAWWDDPALPEKIDAFAPHLVFVVHGRRAAQRWGSVLGRWKTAVWLVDEPYEVDDTARWSGAFGTVFVNDAATLARHRNAHLLPVCFDPLVHHDVTGPRAHRVGFVGGYNPVRERYLLRLLEEGLLSYVIGGPWKAPTLQRIRLAERCPPAETARLYQGTQIVLNVFRSQHHFNRAGLAATALNPRVFEALACGALVVSEPRPALAASFPEVPTFADADELVATVRRLLADPGARAAALAAGRARLAGEDYAHRLASALEIALGPLPAFADGTPLPVLPETRVMDLAAPTSIPAHARSLPEGWEAVGPGVALDAAGQIVLTARGEGESGIAGDTVLEAVKLSFEVRLDARCRFIAKVHHLTRADPAADSYHLLATPERAYVARQHVVLAPLALAPGAWRKVEMSWSAGLLIAAVDGREACRCRDDSLAAGYCFIGVSAGTAELRAPRVETPAAEPRPAPLEGWSIQGSGSVTSEEDHLVLAASAGAEVSLVSLDPANDLELEFALRLDEGAHFIAKIHHQCVDDPDANSYHLISTPAGGYLARHRQVFGEVRFPRRVWQRLRLRWVDQCLELFVNDRRRVRVADNLLQSGYCVLGLTAGTARLRNLAVRDLSALKSAALPARAAAAPRPGQDAIPFTATPLRNLMYHVWPVRGQMWRWNVEQMLSRIDLFNGRRLIGIVHDARSEDPEEVRRMFDGHGCEFIVAPNAPSGEGVTFPAMLARVQSQDPDEVTFYAHAKGVKYEPSIPPAVRRWAETQYRAALDDWPAVRDQLDRLAMTGSFKMLGRFRAHQYLGDWHYSGTFFWLRHAYVFGRAPTTRADFYGCVEAWPGLHFRREETGCLFMDGLRQLPYRDEFWNTVGDAAFVRWEAERRPSAPPADLVTPPPFEGWSEPRLEQHPEEFSWFLAQLLEASPRTVLVIGAMHGGVEWHVARRFRALGLDVRITAVDLAGRRELRATAADAQARFGQEVEVVIGDSTAPGTRAQLAAQYDAVFIDGDHSYRGARADFDFALTRSPRMVALHDIADSDWHARARCCVSRLWSELQAQYVTGEKIVGEWGGIGVVRP